MRCNCKKILSIAFAFILALTILPVDIDTVSMLVAEASSAPAAPLSITYTRTATKEGFADGTVNVKLNTASGGQASELVLYFADSEGNPLDGYMYLQKQPVASGVTELTFDMVENTLIPAGSKKLIAYASNSYGMSAGYASVELPEGVSDYEFGTPLFEFQIVSDTHVTDSNSHIYNQRFKQMLEDVVTTSPDSKGIVVVGDVTDTGAAKEYENVISVYEAAEDAPRMYWSIGNHDYALSYGDTQTQRELFLQYSGLESVYYDEWIADTHFVFLGSEETDTASGTGAIISDTQLDWLETTLADGYEEGRPIFVFLHQSVYNTVAGSLPGQGWDGIGVAGVIDDSEARLMSILAEYPEAIFFSGHSHWEMNSTDTMYERTASMCTAFNTASVAYLWTSYGDTYSGGWSYDDEVGGSQGYYVKVYEDKVLVIGRDFEDGGLWIPSATYCIDMTDLAFDDSEGDDSYEEMTVSMDKYVFGYGEEIRIGYTNADLENENTWLCIYNAGDIPGTSGICSKQYAYIDGDGTVIFNNLQGVTSDSAALNSPGTVCYNTGSVVYLAPGDYYATILGGAGWYTSYADTVYFSVEATENFPIEISISQTEFLLSETINISYSGADLSSQGSWIGIYLKDDIIGYNLSQQYAYIDGSGTVAFNTGSGATDDNTAYANPGTVMYNVGGLLPVGDYIAVALGGSGVYDELSDTVEFSVVEKKTASRGDVDGNGTINMLDVIALRRYLINSTEYPVADDECADSDGSGTVNMLDVIALRRYLINSTQYPLGK